MSSDASSRANTMFQTLSSNTLNSTRFRNFASIQRQRQRQRAEGFIGAASSQGQQGTWQQSRSFQQELATHLRSELWPEFVDKELEASYLADTTSTLQKECFRMWIVLSLAWIMLLVMSCLDVQDWWRSSPDPSLLALEVIKMSCHFILIQHFLLWSKVSHIRVSLDTKIAIAGIVWAITMQCTNPARIGLVVAGNNKEFENVDSADLSESLMIAGVIVLIEVSTRATRSCILSAVVWPLYSFFILLPHFLGKPPRPLQQSVLAIIIIGVIALGVWIRSCQAECSFRVNWLRANILDEEVGQLTQEVEEHVMASTYSVENTTPFQKLRASIEAEKEDQIQACKVELVEKGFELRDVEDEEKACRKQHSEECGICVAFILSDEFEKLVQERTGESDPTFLEMKDPFFKGENGIGANKVCPRDGEKGCSFLDSLPKSHRGKATHFLSWLWLYRFSLVRNSLRMWVKAENLVAETTFIFMCFAVNNQHRLANGSDNLDTVFEKNLGRIGRMVAILGHWDSPDYLKRIWTIFEQLTAIKLDIPVTMILPVSATKSLLNEFSRGAEGIRRVQIALSNVDSAAAKATYAADEDKVKEVIANSIGFAAVNAAVSGFMAEWVGQQVQHFMKNLCSSSAEVAGETMTMITMHAHVAQEEVIQSRCRGSVVKPQDADSECGWYPQVSGSISLQDTDSGIGEDHAGILLQDTDNEPHAHAILDTGTYFDCHPSPGGSIIGRSDVVIR